MASLLVDTGFLVALGRKADPLHAAAKIWLANRTGVRQVLTTDSADFGVYRLRNGKRFEQVKWFERQSRAGDDEHGPAVESHCKERKK